MSKKPSLAALKQQIEGERRPTLLQPAPRTVRHLRGPRRHWLTRRKGRGG